MSAVVSKAPDVAHFGNDTVLTKRIASGNYGAMFIRVRRRKLKGGHPDCRAYRTRSGNLVTESASYDVVRAKRVDGKPRQEFLCGLGSVKQKRPSERAAAVACVHAICRMERAGFDAPQRRKLLLLAHAKGFPLPTHETCVALADERARFYAAHAMEVSDIVREVEP